MKTIKLIAAITFLGLMLVHLIAWLGILPPKWFWLPLSVVSMSFFVLGCGRLGIHQIKSGTPKTVDNPIEAMFQQATAKRFLIVFLVGGYFFFNFSYSSAIGGVTKYENNKFYVLGDNPEKYYEVSEQEYEFRRPHQVRLYTGHPFVFGLIGYFFLTRQLSKPE
ncbi:hypothetical protein [Gilvimarinus xylanilyticus]|uniref:Uncharacterized protein n=1 Tax=Gilvimarinus xylanilyticus TaxID=2944139 RepID=A0A9X2KWX5_9GAMM|nr:hypothetical protein [Gilvimarinus xylanilyticus]MCP8899670.1 hypothetical protein [Gilvimarinus xylanilyticus]